MRTWRHSPAIATSIVQVRADSTAESEPASSSCRCSPRRSPRCSRGGQIGFNVTPHTWARHFSNRPTRLVFWSTESPRRARHLIGVRFSDNRDVAGVGRRLAARNVFASVRGDAIRVALQVFNDPSDVEALIDGFGSRG